MKLLLEVEEDDTLEYPCGGSCLEHGLGPSEVSGLMQILYSSSWSSVGPLGLGFSGHWGSLEYKWDNSS